MQFFARDCSRCIVVPTFNFWGPLAVMTKSSPSKLKWLRGPLWNVDPETISICMNVKTKHENCLKLPLTQNVKQKFILTLNRKFFRKTLIHKIFPLKKSRHFVLIISSNWRIQLQNCTKNQNVSLQSTMIRQRFKFDWNYQQVEMSMQFKLARNFRFDLICSL